PPGSALHLTIPSTINDRGEIAGIGVLANGDVHAFLLIPCEDGDKSCEGESATGVTKSDSVPAMQKSTAANQSNPMLRLLGRRAMAWHRGVASGADPFLFSPSHCEVDGRGRLTGYCFFELPNGPCMITRSSLCPVGAEAIRKGTTACCFQG